MSDDSDYEVEAIRKWRYNLAKRRKEYLIKWVNYPEDQNTWEPIEHLNNCSDIIKRFCKSLKASEQECLNSKEPEKLTGLQRNAEILHMVGGFERVRSTSGNVKRSRPVIHVTFEDEDDLFETIGIDELREFNPDKAFEFIEQRLIDKETTL